MERLKKDGTPAKKPGRKPVVYEEKIRAETGKTSMKENLLPVSALKSLAIASGVYRRCHDGMMFDDGHAEIILTAAEWKRFSEEICQALRQMGMEE